jgi:ribosomal protein S14
MIYYLKFRLDDLQRKQFRFKEKTYRQYNLNYVLGKRTVEYPPKHRFKSYCFITSAPRSVYRHFSLSRWFFRKYANSGLMVGIQTSSW